MFEIFNCVWELISMNDIYAPVILKIRNIFAYMQKLFQKRNFDLFKKRYIKTLII